MARNEIARAPGIDKSREFYPIKNYFNPGDRRRELIKFIGVVDVNDGLVSHCGLKMII